MIEFRIEEAGGPEAVDQMSSEKLQQLARQIAGSVPTAPAGAH